MGVIRALAAERLTALSSGRPFYLLFLPIAVTLNLGLGIAVLTLLQPVGWLGGLEVATGVFCCVIAGWVAGSAWSKSYWGGAMTRQVNAWRQIVDAIFAWIEEAPLSLEALHRLKGSLDDVLPQRKSNETLDTAR
jgi:hypothetical protein